MAKSPGTRFLKRFETQVGNTGEAIGILKKRGNLDAKGKLTPSGRAAAAKSDAKWGSAMPKGKEAKGPGPSRAAIAAKARAIGGKQTPRSAKKGRH